MRQRLKLQTIVKVSNLHCNFINLGGTAFYLNFLSAFPTKVPHSFHQVSYLTKAYWASQYVLDTKIGAKRIET